MNSELFEIAAKNIKRQGIRTYLTLIGIVIGIAAIVALLSIGSGLGVAIEKQFEGLGTNTIFIIPLGVTGASSEIKNSDIDAIESIRGVEVAVPIYSTAAQFEFSDTKVSINVSAAEAEKSGIFEDTGFFDMKSGRMLTKNDTFSVVIGERIAEDYFDKEISLRTRVKINGKSYRVVGILNEGAQTIGGGGPDTGSTVFMSLKGFEKISDAESPGIVFAQSFSGNDTEEVSERILDYLEDKYGEKSFLVSSSQQLLEQVRAILGLLTIFLTGIAGISLLVGGIGITNAMIASVLERTKEIGLLKALGSANREILTLFLLEAGYIGLVGGVIGIAMGFGLAGAIAFIGEQAGFALVAVMDPVMAIGALAFAMIVGMLSGFYPALRAARLDPIVALRYE